MISHVASETIVTRDLEAAITAWTAELGWELAARAPVDEPLAEFWQVDSSRHGEFAIVAPRGSSRGFVRLVQGDRDDTTGSFHAPGFFNAELLCRDVDELHAVLTR